MFVRAHALINVSKGYCWESVIHDHHNCKAIWMLEIGEILLFVASNNQVITKVNIIKHYTMFWFHVVTPSRHYHLVYKCPSLYILKSAMPNQWHSQGWASRAQALSSICCALPLRLKNQVTLIE